MWPTKAGLEIDYYCLIFILPSFLGLLLQHIILVSFLLVLGRVDPRSSRTRLGRHVCIEACRWRRFVWWNRWSGTSSGHVCLESPWCDLSSLLGCIARLVWNIWCPLDRRTCILQSPFSCGIWADILWGWYVWGPLSADLVAARFLKPRRPCWLAGLHVL